MVGMFFANVFDTKVINDETKTEGVPCVVPEAWGVASRCIDIAAKKTDQFSLGKDASLRKTIHSAAYFHIYFSIVDNVSEFVVHDDFLGDGVDGDEHLFVIIHWCAKIVVFNVQAEPMSTWGRECAVHEIFESCHVCHCHTQIARVIDEVAANGDACAVRFSFLGTVAADKTGIGRSFVFGDLGERNKEYSVGRFHMVVWEALHEATKFI